MSKTGALVLAAGKGTRMHSLRPKVLQTLLGEPMLAHVHAALRPVFSDDVWTVVGHRADLIAAAFPSIRTVMQAEQLGTGHALAQALPELVAAGCERVLVVNGDAPLLSEAVVRSFMEQAQRSDLAFATLMLGADNAYGRVVRKNGDIVGIVEAKDYDRSVHGPESGEVNAGMYLVSTALAASLLPRVGNANKSGEYYITDLVGLALADGCTVLGIECGQDESLLGVNSPLELARMEEIMRKRTVESLLLSGVILHAPELVRISPLASIAPGAELTGPCEVIGASRIAGDVSIASHCVVRDSEIREGAQIHSFSHLDGAVVGPGALVGPFARLRPGAVLEEASHVGNFVELKKAVLGKGAKANHLSYLGDATVGAGANIGAGTITCNYDGKAKHRTEIGEKAFIGSNSALVAPVKVGDNALVGAGSVITKEVGQGEMAIARGKQMNFSHRP